MASTAPSDSPPRPRPRLVDLALNWFVVDTGISAAHGVWVNVAFNAFALLSTLVPLALLVPWLRQR